ncbi:hypothetical protein [Candidatus Solincola sp.]
MKRIQLSEMLVEMAGEKPGDATAENLSNRRISLGTRKIIQEALEAEVIERPGGERCKRTDGESLSWHNGCKRRHIDCDEDRIEIDLPQVGGTEEPFHLDL